MTYHRQVGVAGRLRGGLLATSIDEGLYDVVTTLWRHDIETLYSCQGGAPHDDEEGDYYDVHLKGYVMFADGHDAHRALEVLGWDTPGMVLLERWPTSKHPLATCIRFYDVLDMHFHLSPDEPSALVEAPSERPA